MSTDVALDTMCQLTPYIANIVSDENLLNELKKTIDLKNVENKAHYLTLAAEKITALIPILLRNRKEDVLGILATLNFRSIDEIKNQTILTTMQQIREAVQDKDLIDFFKSCMDTEEGE